MVKKVLKSPILPPPSSGSRDENKIACGILWVVREHPKISYVELMQILYGEWAQLNHIDYDVRKILKRLHDDYGLIEISYIPRRELDILFDPPNAYGRIDKVHIKLTKKLLELQNLLGFSLTEKLEEETFVKVQPLFNKPMHFNKNKWAQVFVLMPFKDSMRHIYIDHILPATKQLNLTCKRGDDFFSSEAIMREVWSSIYHADLCIADCTERNPNVFYEIGVAHTIGRPCILIAQSKEDIPFDIGHLRHIIYEDTLEGWKVFEGKLKSTLQHELELTSSEN